MCFPPPLREEEEPPSEDKYFATNVELAIKILCAKLKTFATDRTGLVGKAFDAPLINCLSVSIEAQIKIDAK